MDDCHPHLFFSTAPRPRSRYSVPQFLLEAVDTHRCPSRRQQLAACPPGRPPCGHSPACPLRLYPTFAPARDDEQPAQTPAALRGRGLPCALFPGPPLLPAPTPSSEPAALPPCPALLSSGATLALPLRSGLRRAAPRGAGEAGAGRGRPFPPPREEVTWRRRRRGGKARGALFFPEPPGGWSLAAPPEPAASRRVQTSGSWCGSAAAPPPARSRRLSAARMSRPGGARYVLFPWRPASSSGVRPPFSSRRAAPFGKKKKPNPKTSTQPSPPPPAGVL